MTSFVTRSAAETMELGRALSAQLDAGDVVAFYGELGAGKTTMIKGIAAGMGVAEVVKSPSFVIVTEYPGRLPIYHIDLYRLGVREKEKGAGVGSQASIEETAGLGLEDYLGGDGVCLIEWADRAEKVLPDTTIRVRMSVEGSGRRIEIAGLRAPLQPVE